MPKETGKIDAVSVLRPSTLNLMTYLCKSNKKGSLDCWHGKYVPICTFLFSSDILILNNQTYATLVSLTARFLFQCHLSGARLSNNMSLSLRTEERGYKQI